MDKLRGSLAGTNWIVPAIDDTTLIAVILTGY